MAHCEDAAMFLGPVGAVELASLPQQATDALIAGLGSGQFVADLDRDVSPTGYLFRCRQCFSYLGYVDRD